MTSTSPVEQILTPAAQFTYEAFQQGKSVFATLHKGIASRLASALIGDRAPETVKVDPQILVKIQQRLNQLLERDWKDAQAGVYPKELLFDNPWQDFFLNYPLIWVDMPGIWQRIRDREYQKFESGIDLEGYPKYYLQNFHYQTNGYLSDLSAELYDLQVDILFNGAADAMRRRILAPLKAGLTEFADLAPHDLRVLDVACGTGRTLRLIRTMLPQGKLYGTDMSPAYLRKADSLLGEIPGELPQLVQANAEELPYRDNYFHGVSCVFTFHELPADARQRVIDEAYRVIQPGGTFVICDSIQAIDSPELMPMMQNFPAMFHEPYYKHYVTDDLCDRLEKAGFEVLGTENHFVSKYWIARKSVDS